MFKLGEDWVNVFLPKVFEKFLDKSDNYREMADKEENLVKKAEFYRYSNIFREIFYCFKEAAEEIVAKK